MKSSPPAQDTGDQQEDAREKRQRERPQNGIVKNDRTGSPVDNPADKPIQEAADAARPPRHASFGRSLKAALAIIAATQAGT